MTTLRRPDAVGRDGRVRFQCGPHARVECYDAAARAWRWRLLPSGRAAAEAFLAKYPDVLGLAHLTHPRRTRAALRRFGADEVRTAVYWAVLHAVRRWHPDRARLLTVLEHAIRAEFQLLWRALDRDRAEDARGDWEGVPGPAPDPGARTLVEDELRGLPPREREAVVRRYGLCGGPAETQAEVAADWGVRASRVGQVEGAALKRLRRRAAARDA